MSQSRLKGEDGGVRSEGFENFDERDLPIKLKVALCLLNNLRDLHLLRKEQFCDLVFELNGEKFPAHRLILALWSPVMMNMLNISTSKTERIQLVYDQPGAFRQFLTFLYTGSFDGSITDVLSLLLLASTFQISILRDLCEEHLLQTMEVTNVISLFHISVSYQLTCLEWQCADYVRQHLPEVAQHSEMRDLNAEQMNSFLGSDHISKLDPEMKLFLLISWLTEDVPNRQQFLVMLLGHIDWSTVADDFLMDISQTDNFFTSNPSSLYLLLQTLHSSSISLGPYADHFEKLRAKYSYLLNSVVNSSVHLGMGKHSQFQPIAMSVINNTSTQDVTSRNCELSENEDDSPVNDEQNNHEPSDESIESVNPQNTNDTIPKTSLEAAIISSASQEGKNSQKKMDSGNWEASKRLVTDIPCAGSMRRKRLKPTKLVSGAENVLSSGFSPPEIDLLRQRKCEKHMEQHVQRRTLRNTARRNKVETVQSKSQKPDRNKNSLQDIGQNSKVKTSAGKTDNVKSKNVKLVKIKERTETTLLKAKETDLGVTQSKDTDEVRKRGRPKKGQECPHYECPDCEYISTKKNMLDRHINQVHKGNHIFKCSLCEFECKWYKTYNDHLKSEHFNGPHYVCDYNNCTFSSDKLKTLMTHRGKHREERPFVCSICRMSFKRKTNLHSHLRCHKDERKFKCPVCDRSFKLKNTLDQHIVTHNDLRPYLCDLCGFSTKYQSHLISHKKNHAGDVFPCTFPSCSYSTPKRSQLKAHMRSHLGIRHHVCGTCGKAFIERSHLLRHEKIHSSVKDHKCSICDYASNRADKLREHMKKHKKHDDLFPEAEGKKGKRNKVTVSNERDEENADHHDNVSDINVAPDQYIITITTPNDDTSKTSQYMSHSSKEIDSHDSEPFSDHDVCWEISVRDTRVNSSPKTQGKMEDVREKHETASTEWEKDLNAANVLTNIGSAALNSVTHAAGEHQMTYPVTSGYFSSTNPMSGENSFNEVPEIMLPGMDMTSTLYSGHQQLQCSHPQQGMPMLPTAAHPTPSQNTLGGVRVSAFPHQHHMHPKVSHNANYPHPLIMVPNINSSLITHQ